MPSAVTCGARSSAPRFQICDPARSSPLTGSARRVQLANLRPDLGFVELRGNIATRVSRAPANGAAVVALAALERLGEKAAIAEVLSVQTMLPQVGQGAIALRCREDIEQTSSLLAQIDDVAAHRAVRAERAFLRHFGTGCDLPLAAYATCDGIEDEILIEACSREPRWARAHPTQTPTVSTQRETGSQLARRIVGSDAVASFLGVSSP